MWKTIIDRILRGMMVQDRLTVTYPDGTTQDYGPECGKRAHVCAHNTKTLRGIVFNPDIGFGEGYMDGGITLRDCTLDQLMEILIRNRNVGKMYPWFAMLNSTRTVFRRFLQRNAPGMARRNVAHHYDISDDFYRLFLDEDMQYSCGYFPDDGMTLQEAQAVKKEHIARKLLPEPGARVLDVGCGWGGMAITLARDFDCRVTGITLSQNQLATARNRAAKAGVEDRVDFELRDYREIEGCFDRIVSVGMLEHVGIPNYATYFRKISDMLAPDGIALIHTIGWSAPPKAQSPWINKYIFPGGHVPTLSELVPAIERSGLMPSDIEVLRLHYARTLEQWRARFDANSEAIRNCYDERFLRMFRYYLTVSKLAFEHQPQVVYQFQLAHRHDTVPVTRDYLYDTPAHPPGMQPLAANGATRPHL